MRKLPLWYGIAILVIILGVSGQVLAVELFPPEEVRPGLRGTAKTVISGNTIETFDVEVLGLVPQSPPLSSLIMVKVSGDVIERSGGIARGMSGSPVYIQDRLLGAISYTYAYSDHRIGLVTPAVDMFKIFDEMPAPEPVLPEDVIAVASPLVIQGMNERNLDYLLGALGVERVQVMPSIAASTSLGPAAFEPGSMFGVQLLRGDFMVASYGTVTHVLEDGRFVAMGHPVFHRGPVEFFASAVYVHHTMPNLEVPSKIVSLGATVGKVAQDRAAGVGGILGEPVHYVPITISVTDMERGVRRDFYVESIKDEQLISSLVISSAYQAIDAALDRVGDGTAYVRLEFVSKDFTQRMIRENLFYSDSDIAVWCLVDLLSGLELLMGNNLQAVDLQQVKIEVEVSKERKTATIEKATPSHAHVKAGESVDVEVLIRPYRGQPETRTLRLQIPPDTAEGLLTVTVRSGAESYFATKPPVHTSILDAETQEDEEPMRAFISDADTLDDLIEEYMDGERNNELVAEFYPFLENHVEQEEEGSEEDEEETLDSLGYYAWAEPVEPVVVRLSTQFVLDGLATFDLSIYH
ncbi:SpoIVB peptidase S55 domain-containing protein [Candidatus Darwinibacter acetoxidans]|jgi:hypothetical protein|nr:SpoIVB peptidase S55 domain-containing protein [Bacillota bacterium]